MRDGGVDLADGTTIRARAVVVGTDGTTDHRLAGAGLARGQDVVLRGGGEPVLVLDGDTAW